MPAYRHERHFSVPEAAALLAEVKPLVEELAALKQVLDAEGFSFTPPPEPSTAVKRQINGHQPPPEAFLRLQQVLYAVAERDSGAGPGAGAHRFSPHSRQRRGSLPLLAAGG